MAELEREHSSKMAAINAAKENIAAAVSKQNKQYNNFIVYSSIVEGLFSSSHGKHSLGLVSHHFAVI